MTRTVLEGQLKQMILFYRIFLNRIVDNRLKILNFDQIGFIKQKKTLFSCNGKQKVILLHDKTRPHVAKTVRERIENLGREVLPHSAYSPQLYLINTCSDRCSISSRRKSIRKLKVSKKTSIRIFPPDHKDFPRVEYNHCQKDGRRSY